MKTALITGGAGFIGSHLADRLIADGWRVVAFDNLAIGRLANIDQLRGHERFSFVEGDIADVSRLAHLIRESGADTIFHLAAVHYIPFCEANPFEAMRVNALGTQAVIDAAAGGGLRRIVLTSTSDVYAMKDEPFVETDPVDPYTVYGTSKSFAERMLRLATIRGTGLSAMVARLFNVYGSRETNPHVLPEMLDQIRAGARAVKLGNLWPRRDFVYVADVVDALVELARAPGAFDVFNVGSGTATSVEGALQAFADLVGEPISAVADPERTRRVERATLHADVTKLTASTAWRPRWSLREGLSAWIAAEDPVRR